MLVAQGELEVSDEVTLEDLEILAAIVENRGKASKLIVAEAGDADFTSISAAVRASTPGQVILVRPGTYREA